MNDLAHDIAAAAEDAVALCQHLRGEPLDYSEASLMAVDEVLAEAAAWVDELTPEQL